MGNPILLALLFRITSRTDSEINSLLDEHVTEIGQLGSRATVLSLGVGANSDSIVALGTDLRSDIAQADSDLKSALETAYETADVATFNAAVAAATVADSALDAALVAHRALTAGGSVGERMGEIRHDESKPSGT